MATVVSIRTSAGVPKTVGTLYLFTNGQRKDCMLMCVSPKRIVVKRDVTGIIEKYDIMKDYRNIPAYSHSPLGTLSNEVWFK